MVRLRLLLNILILLGLAAIAIVLWFYLAAESTPEIDLDTGLAIPEIGGKQRLDLFDRIRAWLGW